MEGGAVQEAEGKGSDRGHLHIVHRDPQDPREGRIVRDEHAEARRNQFLKAFYHRKVARIWVESHRRTVNRRET